MPIDLAAAWDRVWPLLMAFATGGFVTNVKGALELWRMVFPSTNRRHIVVQSTLVSHADAGGNLITLTNLSDRVALLSSWEIVRRSPGWWGRAEKHVAHSDGAMTARIETDAEHRLVFDDDDWFDPWPRDRPKHRIVFRYVITGDKPREVVLTQGR